jgi:hypothetical protein
MIRLKENDWLRRFMGLFSNEIARLRLHDLVLGLLVCVVVLLQVYEVED